MSMPVLLTLPLGLDNGLGRLPPLTFSVWNFFGLHANESVVLETAAALESTGLRKLGYDTVTIDAGSLAGRDPGGPRSKTWSASPASAPAGAMR